MYIFNYGRECLKLVIVYCRTLAAFTPISPFQKALALHPWEIGFAQPRPPSPIKRPCKSSGDCNPSPDFFFLLPVMLFTAGNSSTTRPTIAIITVLSPVILICSPHYHISPWCCLAGRGFQHSCHPFSLSWWLHNILYLMIHFLVNKLHPSFRIWRCFLPCEVLRCYLNFVENSFLHDWICWLLWSRFTVHVCFLNPLLKTCECGI